MKCVHCNKVIKGTSHNTMTTILFHKCECDETVALDKGKIRALNPNEKAFLRPPITITSRAGILTCFPSTTPFGLALGVDSPCPD